MVGAVVASVLDMVGASVLDIHLLLFLQVCWTYSWCCCCKCAGHAFVAVVASVLDMHLVLLLYLFWFFEKYFLMR
jgi:hypothetical protein